MKTKKLVFCIIVCLVSAVTGFSQTRQASPFSVGAAKVDMTPSVDALPENFTSILDNLFCRAIVIENEATSAALVAVDEGMISNESYDKWTKEIEEATGIPALNIYICASHTHSAPFGGLETTDFALVEAVKQAHSKLQPAQMSFNAGLSYLNVNRDVINPVTRLWSQGPNYEGPSDKTVAVIQFTDPNGEPVAVLYNYAMHANTMYMTGMISADFPGQTSKYIEEYYDNNVVALFSSGAAGDQNPLYFMSASSRVSDRREQMIASMGQFLGEEVLRVMSLPQRSDSTIRIYSSQQTVTCPGRTRTNTGREGAEGTYVDGDPVNIKLSLLRLGDVAVAAVNAELYNVIGQRLKAESPLNNTIVSTITNGRSNSGYIPSDDAFQRYTFQVLGSRLKPNCAERAIIDGLLDMIEKSE